MSLFTPFDLTKNVSLKHRVVMAPLTRMRATVDDGCFIPEAATYYEQRATEGALIIAEAALISPLARGAEFMPGIYTEEHINSWKNIVDTIHKKNAFTYLQLLHFGRCSHSSLHEGTLPVAPSAVASEECGVLGKENAYLPMETPKELTVEEIQQIIADFHAAAGRARAAGFDGVEVHGANGYLIQQFLSSNVNQRTDQYGGNPENRARFAVEVVAAVVKGWLGLPLEATADEVAALAGEDRIDVGLRLSPWCHYGDIQEGEDAAEVYESLLAQIENSPAKLAYVHFIEPRVSNSNDLELAEGVCKWGHSKRFRPLFSGAVISAGGYSTEPLSGNEAIDDGSADLVAYGRVFIATPDLVDRLRNDLPMNKWVRDSFYTQTPVEGYTDYPTWDQIRPKDEKAGGCRCM